MVNGEQKKQKRGSKEEVSHSVLSSWMQLGIHTAYTKVSGFGVTLEIM